jgi:hypothetical protein
LDISVQNFIEITDITVDTTSQNTEMMCNIKFRFLHIIRQPTERTVLTKWFETELATPGSDGRDDATDIIADQAKPGCFSFSFHCST